MPEVPKDLLEALESGSITRTQLEELIQLEAEGLGLTADEAKRLAESGELPKSALGLDLASLVGLLGEMPSAA